MTTPLFELEPRSLWAHFDAIRNIPRPSKKEERIRQHVLDWAAKRGFETLVDDAGSVVVRVPATRGHESAPSVVIQGHLDMVGEKHSGSAFDFDTDPIDAYVDGDWVRARGTTLGADNGIGVAAGMAAADDPDVLHGPLELLLTIDEETGLTGASRLEPGFVSGTVLLNLDSEEDGTLYVGCAGGGDADILLPLHRLPPLHRTDASRDGTVDLAIRVAGGKGGHSGLDIRENRMNALRVLARAIRDAGRAAPVALVAFDGGDKHNAIPREAAATVRLARADVDAVRAALARTEGRAREEFGVTDPDLAVTASEPSSPSDRGALDAASGERLIQLVLALPHGVLAMSRDIPGLVETSNNMARVNLEDSQARILTSSRSSVAPAIDEVREQIRACAALGGGEARLSGGYPGWRPDMASPLLAMTKDVYRDCFGRPPEVAAIHAGLECGIIGERYPAMDMISFGPEIRGAHSPDECVCISSTARFWTLLKALLARLAGAGPPR